MAEVWKTRIFLFVLFLNDAVWRDSLGERMHEGRESLYPKRIRTAAKLDPNVATFCDTFR